MVEEDKRRKRTKTVEAVHDSLIEFCQNTSLHGFKYVSEKDRSRSERLMWMLALILSISACCYLVHQVWDKWNTSPVIYTQDEAHSIHSWDVPFPAVTVCSQTKIRQSVFNFTDATLKSNLLLTKDELQQKVAACLICKANVCGVGHGYDSNEDSVDFLKRAAPPSDEVIWIGRWLFAELYPIKPSISTIMTEEGICYSFNLLDLKQLYTHDTVHSDHSYLNSSQQSKSKWTPNEGYPDTESVGTYPHRALLGSKDVDGLTLRLISYHEDVDYLCGEADVGFKVFIHNPAEIPQSEEHIMLPVDLNKQLTVTVTPHMKTTSERLRDYPPMRRRCFYPHERTLRFFQVYTQSNCELECFANYTLEACKCVPFYMPRTSNTTICSLYNRQVCFKEFPVSKQVREISRNPRYKVTENVYRSSLDNWIHTMSKDADLNHAEADCNCLPACTSLDYQISKIDTRDWDWKSAIKVLPFFDEMMSIFKRPIESFSMSKIDIKIKDITFPVVQRSELFGRTDFFANCGGLLGLCMGFSILSLVEMIYYCSLRIWTRLRQTKNTDLTLTENLGSSPA